jgi:hypothetical protein
MTSSRRPFFINLAILTLITAVIWIIYSVYVALAKPVEIAVPPEALENFEAQLDAEALSKLQQSIHLTERELEESVSVVVAPEPEPEETPAPTEEPEEEIPANDETQP